MAVCRSITVYRTMMIAMLAGTVALVGAPGARADDKADALVKQVVAAYRAAKTLTANVSLSYDGMGQKMSATGSMTAKKPNFLRLDMTGGTMGQTVVNDGKNLWMHMKSQNQFMKLPADQMAMFTGSMPGIGLFFDQNLLTGPGVPKPKHAGFETVDGARYEVLEVAQDPAALKFYVGPDKLVHRMRMDMKQGSNTMAVNMTMKNVRIGSVIAARTFVFTRPKNAKLFDMKAGGGGGDYEAKLVMVGKPAPNFTLPTPDGGQIALGETLRGKKALLVNFWFHG